MAIQALSKQSSGLNSHESPESTNIQLNDLTRNC